MTGVPDELRKKPRKRSRDDGGSDRRAQFLTEYARWGVISRAATAAGVTRQTYYNWVVEDPGFTDRCAEARVEYLEGLEARLKELIDQGNVTAVLAALKAELPEKYGDRTRIQFVPDKEVIRTVAEVIARHVDGRTLQAILADLDNVGAA